MRISVVGLTFSTVRCNVASRFTCRTSLTGDSVLTVYTLAMVDARATEVHDQAHVRPRWATHRQQQKPGAKGLSYK